MAGKLQTSWAVNFKGRNLPGEPSDWRSKLAKELEKKERGLRMAAQIALVRGDRGLGAQGGGGEETTYTARFWLRPAAAPGAAGGGSAQEA